MAGLGMPTPVGFNHPFTISPGARLGQGWTPRPHRGVTTPPAVCGPALNHSYSSFIPPGAAVLDARARAGERAFPASLYGGVCGCGGTPPTLGTLDGAISTWDNYHISQVHRNINQDRTGNTRRGL